MSEANPVDRFVKPLRTLSLGAGVQSTTMLMLAIHGEIERPDHVIFSDTGLEPKAVYRHAEWCKKQCMKAGIPFHIVKAPMDMREDFEAFERGEKKYWDARPPLYVTQCGETGDSQARRQCTDRAKLRPIRKKQKELLGVETARGLPDAAITDMIGISTDEARRAAPALDRWVDRVFPLIDPMKMSRADCQAWWQNHYPHVSLPSSSCVICPFKTTAMWAQMKRSQPEDFAYACDLDDRIRAAYQTQTGQDTFIHNRWVPLREADLNEDQQSLDLADAIYCSGGCGL